ncbi:MAG: hypothetical protein IJZ37_03930 [Clostridia bacterium]|nr:hypothetical protein [Clostridia bacterium]
MKGWHKFLRITAVFCALLFLLGLFAGCGEGAGVTPACIAYSAGAAGEQPTLNWNEEEQQLLPAEIVRATALLAAFEKGYDSELMAARVVYDYSAVYMKEIVSFFGTPQALLSEMNDVAKELSLEQTSFGNVTGTVATEKALYEALELEQGEFVPAYSTVADLTVLGKALYENETLRALYGTQTYRFGDSGGGKSRNAPLLRKGADQYLENALFYLFGTVTDGNKKMTGVAIAAVEEDGKIAFSAVAEHSGLEDPTLFAAADGGNLCGQVLGKNYGLNYNPKASSNENAGDKGTVRIGTNLFYVIVFLFLAVLGVLAVVGITFSVINTVKRNREGRRKYCTPKEQPKSGEEEEQK